VPSFVPDEDIRKEREGCLVETEKNSVVAQIMATLEDPPLSGRDILVSEADATTDNLATAIV
jgi:hypothetical protein